MVVETAGTDGAVKQSGGRRVRIDVWTDLVCPWCYVGQGRLDRAIAEEGVDVELVVHSFELDPSSPHAHDNGTAPGGAAPSNIDHLVSSKGMPREQVVAMEERIGGMAAELNMPYAQERPMANTRTLHRVVQTVAATVDEAAGARDVQPDPGKLLRWDLRSVRHRCARAEGSRVCGRPRTRCGPQWQAKQLRRTRRWKPTSHARRSLGAQGVPFMVFDNRVAAPGAMDVATLPAGASAARRRGGGRMSDDEATKDEATKRTAACTLTATARRLRSPMRQTPWPQATGAGVEPRRRRAGRRRRGAGVRSEGMLTSTTCWTVHRARAARSTAPATEALSGTRPPLPARSDRRAVRWLRSVC